MRNYIKVAVLTLLMITTRGLAAEHLWDMLAINGHALRDVVFTSTGDKMILAMQDSIQIRDPDTGMQIASSFDVWAVGHPGLLLLPGDSEIVAFNYRSRTLVKCNILHGTMTQITQTDSSIVSLQCLSDDKKFVVTVQNAPYNWYKRWDLATGKQVDSWKSELNDSAYSKINFDSHTASMAFVDGSYFCSQDTAYKLWGEWQHVFTGTAHYSSSTHVRLDSVNRFRLLAISPDGNKHCYSAEWTENASPATMIIWNKEDASLKSLSDIVAVSNSTFRFSDDSKYVLAWTHSRDSLLVIDAQNPKIVAAYGATKAFGSMSRRGIVAVNSLYYLEVFRFSLSDVKDDVAHSVKDALFDPSTERAKLMWSGSKKPNSVVLTDVSGRVIAEQLTSYIFPVEQLLEIDLKGVPPGMYIISVQNDRAELAVYKVIITR